MKQQRRYKEPQDTLWGKFLSGFMAVVFAMSTLTLIPIASAINGEPNEAQIQQQEELADQTSGKDEKADEPAADEQKLEPVELLGIASVEDEDDADDATPADVTLKVKAQNATVTYNGKDAAIELVVPADKDVKFTVKAADGFTLGAAAVKLADAKGETTLTPNAGEYTVAADRVADGATIVVTAEAVAGSANTDAAKPSTSAPSTELGEKTANAESIITSIIDSVFGGTSTLAITGEDKVAVGKTIQLSGSSNGKPSCKYQTWTSDDGNVATVNSSGKVTGIKAGKVTITHTYCNAGWLESCHHDGNGNSTIKSETFEITVTDPGAETGSWVYVYTQVTGDTTGLVVNEDGWFTLGKVFIPSLRAATVSEDTNKTIASEEMEQTVINAVKSDKFIRYSKNQGVSIDDVNFKRQNNTYGNHGLHKAQQAADYDEAPYYAWHLDGTVEVRNLGSVVYRCVDDLGNQLEANIPAETFSVGTDVNRSTADAPAISGYTCKAVAQSKDERVPTEGDSNVSFSVEHATHYVTYIYEKNTYALTTQADQNSTIDQGQTYEYSADGTIDVAFSANTGYTVTSVKVDGAELDEAALAAAVAAGKVTVGKTADHSVEVATTINTYALTTQADQNSTIDQGQTYEYSADGTIDGPARYVLNKYDAAGNLAEDGVAVLTAAQIPGTTADDGYGNGVWNNEPLANMELTDDTAFVIAFTALPAAAVVVPPLAPVAAAAPAAAAAAAATILDDGVPLATIDDDENALAAFEEIHCWTHWLMIFGALVTIVYGLAVLYRRRHGIRDMDDFEGDIMGGRKYDAAAEKSPAAGNAFQAM